MAENHIREVHKVVKNCAVYLRMENRFYRLIDIEMKGSEAGMLCRGVDDGKELQVKLAIDRKLIQDLLGFGLRDKKNTIFIIVKDAVEKIWFETSVETLTEEMYRRELGRVMKRKLGSYHDIEET